MTPRRTSETKDFMTAAWKNWAKQVSKKELLRRKKLGRKRNMQAIVDGSSEPSRKKLLLAKEEEVKELQAQLEAVKKELREERKRNFELQETVIKGMGKVQLQLAALQGSIRFTASMDSLEDAQVQEPICHLEEAAAPSPVAIGSPSCSPGPSRHRTEQDALWMAASSSLTGCHSSGLPGHHSDEEAWDSEWSGGDEPIGKDEVGLGQGIVIPREKWERLLEEPKDSIFVRETAKVVWGTKNLYNRSVTGAPCRRYLHKEKEGGVAAPKKRALTPRKLQVLHAAFECHIQAHESAVDSQVRRRAVNRYLADMLKTLVKKEDACVVLHEK
ncbi:uncharacterized protein LOC144159731 [Haemaphysalis longicornis]